MPKGQSTSACANCRHSHAGCNDLKPCDRCIKLGTADTCIASRRKKRSCAENSLRKGKLTSSPPLERFPLLFQLKTSMEILNLAFNETQFECEPFEMVDFPLKEMPYTIDWD